MESGSVRGEGLSCPPQVWHTTSVGLEALGRQSVCALSPVPGGLLSTSPAGGWCDVMTARVYYHGGSCDYCKEPRTTVCVQLFFRPTFCLFK